MAVDGSSFYAISLTAAVFVRNTSLRLEEVFDGNRGPEIRSGLILFVLVASLLPILVVLLRAVPWRGRIDGLPADSPAGCLFWRRRPTWVTAVLRYRVARQAEDAAVVADPELMAALRQVGDRVAGVRGPDHREDERRRHEPRRLSSSVDRKTFGLR